MNIKTKRFIVQGMFAIVVGSILGFTIVVAFEYYDQAAAHYGSQW